MEKPQYMTHLTKWLGDGSINLFGRPFAGKDTQGRILADLFDGHLLGGGDILRGSSMPDDIKQAMRSGELIPSASYVKIVLPYLSQNTLKNKPLILSSVGRWHGEEDGVIQALQTAHHSIRGVVYIALDDQDVISRWKHSDKNSDRLGRHDDTEEILQTRLMEFHAKTIPVIEYYRHLGLLVEVDGRLPKKAVTDQVIEGLVRLSREA